MKNVDWEEVIVNSLLGLCVGFLCLSVYLAICGTNKKERLYSQCLKDGVKEYECYSKIHAGRRY